MKKVFFHSVQLIVLLSLLLSLQACGSTGGGSDSSGSDSTGTDSPTTGSTDTTTPAGTPISNPGTLGPLQDIGDLVADGENWYYTDARSINNGGLIVGQSNAGTPVKAAFSWDPQTESMTFLGIHGGTYDDPYSLKTTSSKNFFIYSEAVKINNSGIVICNSTTGKGWPNEEEKRAFVYDPSSIEEAFDLSPPPIFNDDGSISFKNFSEAVDINSNGEVILTAEDETGRHAYYWDGITFDDWELKKEDEATITIRIPQLSMLGKIIGEDGEAVALNDLGHAVINSGNTAIFHDINKDVIESLNHLHEETPTKATGINNVVNGETGRAHIIGNSGNLGFFWDGGAMVSLGTLGGDTSEAVDFNDYDQVIGNSKTASGTTRAFLWTLDASGEGKMTDLGTLGGQNSYAVAINNSGEIIGYAETGETYSKGGVTVNIEHAFLWKDGEMYDLGTHNDFYAFSISTPYPLSRASALSENGKIAGNSLTINSHSRGFFLEPVFP